jgi:hypothetical protein
MGVQTAPANPSVVTPTAQDRCKVINRMSPVQVDLRMGLRAALDEERSAGVRGPVGLQRAARSNACFSHAFDDKHKGSKPVKAVVKKREVSVP